MIIPDIIMDLDLLEKFDVQWSFVRTNKRYPYRLLFNYRNLKFGYIALKPDCSHFNGAKLVGGFNSSISTMISNGGQILSSNDFNDIFSKSIYSVFANITNYLNWLCRDCDE